ncbi:MAG: inositol monophosphatase family protein [Betaproteobacteria bacterium]|jgi:myo-inositol-1(or 4)-monophosphatase
MSPNTPFLAAAVEAVQKAGAIHLKQVGRVVNVRSKGPADIVTDVDFEAERMFRALVAERFPGHGVLAEEMAESAGAAGGRYRWLFDPLDGTANYAHGVPFFCASLALEVDGVIEVAAVYDAGRDELFTAERGGGALLNGRPLAVSRAPRIADAMLGTGFPHGARARDPFMEQVLGECAARARGVRRLGSAALDLCYVACGRLDGFWDRNLKAWDLAAGALIVSEAGGTVTAFNGDPFDPYAGNVLASNGHLHAELLAVVRKPVAL